jgi:hypothetical protein
VAASGRAIGRAGAARAVPAATAVHAPAASARVVRVRAVPVASAARGPAPAAGIVGLCRADRAPRRVPPPEATDATARAPHVEPAEARAERAADGAGAS